MVHACSLNHKTSIGPDHCSKHLLFCGLVPTDYGPHGNKNNALTINLSISHKKDYMSDDKILFTVTEKDVTSYDSLFDPQAQFEGKLIEFDALVIVGR